MSCFKAHVRTEYRQGSVWEKQVIVVSCVTQMSLWFMNRWGRYSEYNE
jgi:hypothetical protein